MNIHITAVGKFRHPDVLKHILLFIDASRVAQRSQHFITKQEVSVKPHHQCIGFLPPHHDTSQPASQIPKEVKFDVESELILAFIMQSSNLR